MRAGMPVASRTSFALVISLLSAVAATAVSASASEPESLAVRVLFLDKLGAHEAQKLMMAEGVQRTATFDPGRAIVVADNPERVAELEAILRKSDPGLLSRKPHAALVAVEGSPEVERTLDTTDARGGVVLLRAIYGIATLEPGRDGHSLRVRDTAEQLDAAESLLRMLGLLAAT